MLAQKLMAAMAGGEETLFSDDVFAVALYTGNGSTQTITNGIDLAGKGGLVWEKGRDNQGGNEIHCLMDTVRGTGERLSTESTAAAATGFSNLITAFNSNGYAIGSNPVINQSGMRHVSWTFRRAPKFFDVVTFTGNGVAGRQISHALGVAPGMVIIKKTSGASTIGWGVWHRSLGNSYYLSLNTTAAQAANANDFWGSSAFTATDIYLGDYSDANQSGATYVAYLFAHDASAEGIIQCGSFTSGGGSTIATVNLGWEPEYILVKDSSGADDWHIADIMRGLTASFGQANLVANSSAAEFSPRSLVRLTATGFQFDGNWAPAGRTFIYLAIRRPNKPPTTGTQVYNAIARTGTSADVTVNSTIRPDLVISTDRFDGSAFVFVDRLRGNDRTLRSELTSAEATSANTRLISGATQTGWRLVGTSSNLSPRSYIDWFFRRAPGVFDVVCYTGTGSARTVAHSLGVVPEVMIFKERTAIGGGSWSVYHQALGNGNRLVLNAADATASNTYLNNTTPTASVFSVSTSNLVNASAATYVAYLFATKAGISYVGSVSHTDGVDTAVNCGFTTGARFVLIKATNSATDWYVFDTTRGIVAGNDPFLRLNSAAAETTSQDAIDPISQGFTMVGSFWGTATYLVLAFA